MNFYHDFDKTESHDILKDFLKISNFKLQQNRSLLYFFIKFFKF